MRLFDARKARQARNDARRQLKAAYQRFLKERDPAHKAEAGKDLIRTIFGNNAIAEDSSVLSRA